jgi:hypothetical protein
MPGLREPKRFAHLPLLPARGDAFERQEGSSVERRQIGPDVILNSGKRYRFAHKQYRLPDTTETKDAFLIRIIGADGRVGDETFSVHAALELHDALTTFLDVCKREHRARRVAR